MKRFFSIVAATFMCIFFLLAGTGLNVVHYCCNACREAGIQHVEESSCEAIHHHEEHHHDGCCHHDNCCWFKHLQVDQAGISQSLHIPAADELQLLAAFLPAAEQSSCDGQKNYHSYFFADSSPGGSGGCVLSRFCRWII